MEQKLAVLREASQPGVNISEVARRHGLTPSQVFKWRRLAELGVIGIPGASELPSFVAVQVAADDRDRPAAERACAPVARADPPPSPPTRDARRAGLIEIVLGSGRRVRVDRDVDAAALERVLAVLDRR